jgi:HSP20 family molecular chaperone IbpA
VTLIGRDPVNEMIARHERFSRLLAGLRAGVWTAAVDVTETPDAIVLRVALAAFDPEDPPARIGDESLTPKGEPRHEDERRQRLYRAVEWADGFKATFEKGVLTLRLSKTQEAKGKRSRNQDQAQSGEGQRDASCLTRPPRCPYERRHPAARRLPRHVWPRRYGVPAGRATHWSPTRTGSNQRVGVHGQVSRFECS